MTQNSFVEKFNERRPHFALGNLTHAVAYAANATATDDGLCTADQLRRLSIAASALTRKT